MKGWSPHFFHAAAQPGAVLGVPPEMERNRTLDLPFGDAVEVHSETSHRLALHVQVSPEQRDRTFYTVTRPRSLRIRAKTRKRSNSEVVLFFSVHVYALFQVSTFRLVLLISYGAR